jgi:hypothetical protein
MTREAVSEGFEQFVEQAVDVTADQFDVGRALRQGASGPGSRVVDGLLKNSETLHRKVVRPELNQYRDDTLAHFEVVVEYAESDADLADYREDLLEYDSFADAIREDVTAERRREIHERLLDRHDRMADAIVPLLDAPESDFWPAVRSELTREEAKELVGDHFTFTDPLVEYRRAFAFETTFEASEIVGGGLGSLLGGLPTVEVEFTDEAVRTMRRAEKHVVARTEKRIDRLYG